MLVKTDILKALATLLEEKVEALNRSLENTRDRARDAPGSNVSHSDTSKFQLSNLALALERQVYEAREALAFLRSIKSDPCSIVSVGAYFSTKNRETGEVKGYFVIPKGGGDTISREGQTVMAISVASPLAKAFLGKEEGEGAAFGGKAFELIEVR